MSEASKTKLIGYILFSFLFYILKLYLSSLESQIRFMGRGRDKDLPVAGSFPKCPQQARLDQTEAKNSIRPSLPSSWQEPKSLSHQLLPLRARNSWKLQPQVEQWRWHGRQVSHRRLPTRHSSRTPTPMPQGDPGRSEHTHHRVPQETKCVAQVMQSTARPLHARFFQENIYLPELFIDKSYKVVILVNNHE